MLGCIGFVDAEWLSASPTNEGGGAGIVSHKGRRQGGGFSASATFPPQSYLNVVR